MDKLEQLERAVRSHLKPEWLKGNLKRWVNFHLKEEGLSIVAWAQDSIKNKTASYVRVVSWRDLHAAGENLPLIISSQVETARIGADEEIEIA